MSLYLFLNILILILILKLILRYLIPQRSLGEIGELKVMRSLGKDIPGEKYVINDLLFSIDGKSHQIDHVLLVKSGIYVIETKNYSGRIYGNENHREWTQVLDFGRVKHRLYNPILQNNSHINALSKILGRKDCFISIIVFPKADIMNQYNSLVGSISDMKRWIQKQRVEMFSSDELEQIYNLLNEYKINPQLSIHKHIENIHVMRQKINENICPRCNDVLVLRQGKYGSFYGCNSFPVCRFIKK